MPCSFVEIYLFSRPKSIASNIREEEDEENTLFRDIGKLIPNNTTLHFRSQ